MTSRIFLLTTILLFPQLIYSQWVQQEQITTFSSIYETPISIEVQERDGQNIFFAISKSSYPFELHIVFSEITNLQPETVNKKIILYPGRNQLVTLRQKNKEIPINYSYSISYSMGNPNKIPDEKYPYLIPIGEGNTTSLHSQDNKYIIDHFAMEPGDTVYCMRKGTVSSLPSMFNTSDRLAQSKSLEIMHHDGTVMIYENLNEDHIFTELSEKVFPGQAIGIMGEEKHLIIQLYQLTGGNNLKRMKILYFIDDKTLPYSHKLTDISAKYPFEIVSKEMNKREVKRYLKTMSK